MTGSSVSVVREGQIVLIDERDLSVGDVVVLQTGDIIPADLELVESHGLEIDMFDITGEILPVQKSLGDENLMFYQGSRVVRGSGKGIVFATGDQTEFARVIEAERIFHPPHRLELWRKEELWAILFSLPALPALILHTGRISTGILVYGLILLTLIFLRNKDLHHFILKRIMSRSLEQERIIIRDVGAIENLRDIDLLCFDKTGVLTTREMRVSQLVFCDQVLNASDGLAHLDESTAQQVITACALCHDVWFYEKIDAGNPVDRAIIRYAQGQGANVQDMLRSAQRIYDQPFTSDSRHMVCGYETADQGKIFLMKGDPLVVLGQCRFFTSVDGHQAIIDGDFLIAYQRQVTAMNERGHKGITLAYALDASALGTRRFTILCLLQIENDLQTGVREVIGDITTRGIRCLLLTGDSPEAAVWVGEQSGIDRESRGYLTGPMIARMSFNEVKRQMDTCAIFARLTPSQKGLLVRLLQESKHRVGMVGDGFNDGIALRVADVGFSFVTGSSPVARKHSGILLRSLDDLVKVFKWAVWLRRGFSWARLARLVLLVVMFAVIYAWWLLWLLNRIQ